MEDIYNYWVTTLNGEGVWLNESIHFDTLRKAQETIMTLWFELDRMRGYQVE